jgi:hypothetical protein
MSKVIEEAVVSEEVSKELEASWYSYQSLLDLINNGIVVTAVLKRYEDAYAHYNKLWSKILIENFKTDYASTNQHDWSFDFNQHKVTITLR